VFHQEIGDRVSPVAIAQKDGRLAYVEIEQSRSRPAAKSPISWG
jgi:hypothetical protein